jgi:DNA-binding transcriptional LysR family regulator
MRKRPTHAWVRLLNRTSRHFAPTQAGDEFYRHAASIVRAAGEAESLVRQRVKEPFGVVRFSAAIGTAQFALREILMNFIQEYPRDPARGVRDKPTD